MMHCDTVPRPLVQCFVTETVPIVLRSADQRHSRKGTGHRTYLAGPTEACPALLVAAHTARTCILQWSDTLFVSDRAMNRCSLLFLVGQKTKTGLPRCSSSSCNLSSSGMSALSRIGFRPH